MWCLPKMDLAEKQAVKHLRGNHEFQTLVGFLNRSRRDILEQAEDMDGSPLQDKKLGAARLIREITDLIEKVGKE
jgi:hypothetical protein